MSTEAETVSAPLAALVARPQALLDRGGGGDCRGARTGLGVASGEAAPCMSPPVLSS